MLALAYGTIRHRGEDGAALVARATPGPPFAPDPANTESVTTLLAPEQTAPAPTAELQEQPARSTATLAVTPHDAAELFCTGKTADALGAYRSLAKSEPERRVYARIVRMLVRSTSTEPH
jgi:hypothetical protein